MRMHRAGKFGSKLALVTLAFLFLCSNSSHARRNFNGSLDDREGKRYSRLCLNHVTAVSAVSRKGCTNAAQYLAQGLQRCQQGIKILRFADEVEPLLSQVRANGIGEFMNGGAVTNIDGRRVTLAALREATNAQAERKQRVERLWGIMNANLEELKHSIGSYRHLVRGSGDSEHRRKFEASCRGILMPEKPGDSRNNISILSEELKRIGGEIHARQKVLTVVRGVDDYWGDELFLSEAELDKSLENSRSLYGTPDLVGNMAYVDLTCTPI